MNTQQQSRPVITPAMREQAAKQPNTWLYVVDPIFTDPNAEIPPWGYIGGYRVDERGQLTDDFSANPNYRPSPVALRLPAPTNDLERALQLTTTGYAQGQTLLMALLEAEVILFAQPQGSGLFTMEHESGRRQLQMFTSDAYLPSNWTTWQRMTGRALANQKPNGLDLQINPTSPIKARVPGEDLIKAAGLLPQQAPETAAGGKGQPALAAAPTNGAITPVSGPNSAAGSGSDGASSPAGQGAQLQPSQQDEAPQSQPHQHEPELSQPATDPGETEFGRRFLGAMLAGAVADALGSAVEFYPVDQIRSRYGERGVTDYERNGGRAGEFTDDTQMALFTAEGLVRGHIAIRKGVAESALPAVQLAYQRWLHTQGYAWTRAAGPFAERHPEPTGWLIKQRDLFSVRSPNSNGITALREFASVGAPATFQRPINDADDCGGVVRAAPVALWSDGPEEVFELAASTAALTYSNANGYLPAGALAVLVHRLLRGEPVEQALRRARALLVGYAGHEDTERLLQSAQELAKQDKLTPEQIKDNLGSGWSGHEALAIAVCAALNTDGIASAVMMAINHSGDSDSTGAICGNIVGALHGYTSLPGVWLRDLKQRETIETVATDALIEFSSAPSADPGWLARYPADQDGSELEFSSRPPKAQQTSGGAQQVPDGADDGPDAEVAPSQASGQSQVSDRSQASEAAQDAAATSSMGQASTEKSSSDSAPESTSGVGRAQAEDSPNDGSPTTEDAGEARTSSSEVSQSGEARTRQIQTRENRSGQAKVLGCLLGGAAGDALGYPIEDESLEGVRAKYGALGLTDFVDAHRPGGSVSDDTQMSLFTLEGLIRAGIRRRLRGDSDPGPAVQRAYQRWLHTQGFDWKEAGGPRAGDSPDGWLIREKGLFVRRAPGTTCVQALHGYASGQQVGTFAHRVNRSRGRGGVMRAAPAGFWSDDPAEAFRAGAATAVLTHGHASGFLPAGALAVIVQQLLADRSIPEAVDRALTELSTWDDHERTSAALRKAIELAATTTPTPEQIQQRLGSGEVGEQALAIAVCAALTHAKSFSAAVALAANHSGNSDSTAAICGNIVGAANGVGSIPPAWREKLELRETIEELGRDAVREFGPNPPTGSDWLERYPVDPTEDAPSTAAPADDDGASAGGTGDGGTCAVEDAASAEPAVSSGESDDGSTGEPAGESDAATATSSAARSGSEQSPAEDDASVEQESGSDPSTQQLDVHQAATTGGATAPAVAAAGVAAAGVAAAGATAAAATTAAAQAADSDAPAQEGQPDAREANAEDTTAAETTPGEAKTGEADGAARADSAQQADTSETGSIAQAMFGDASTTTPASANGSATGVAAESTASTAAAPVPAAAAEATSDRGSSGAAQEATGSGQPGANGSATTGGPATAGHPGTAAWQGGLGPDASRAAPEEAQAPDALPRDGAGTDDQVGTAAAESTGVPGARTSTSAEEAGRVEGADSAGADGAGADGAGADGAGADSADADGAPAAASVPKPEQAAETAQAARSEPASGAERDVAAKLNGKAEQTAKPEQQEEPAQSGQAQSSEETQSSAETESSGEADDTLSDEELRLLAAWRKFREGDEDTPSDLDQGLNKLLVEAFGAERAAQLVGDTQSEPSGSAQLSEPEAVEADTAARLSREQRLEGCVLGLAVGDALAAPWMFAGLHTTLRDNPDGVRAHTEHFGRRGSATALGQQSVFVLDGLLRASVHARLRGVPADTANMVLLSLQHWVCTQGARFDPALPVGLLTESSVLREQRFPDETSLISLTRARSGVPTPGNPPNDARGATAVVRGALAGFHVDEPEEAVSLGSRVAALTHGHPDGHLPSGALAGMVAALRDGRTVADAARTALTELEAFEGGENTARALRSALELAERGPVSPTSLEELGDGWHGPEALAIAVAAVLSRPEGQAQPEGQARPEGQAQPDESADSPFSDALSLAATHSGNSVATAAICGSLLGAAHGVEGIPSEWLRDLELSEVLRQLLADDARVADEIHSDQPAPDWANRYLG